MVQSWKMICRLYWKFRSVDAPLKKKLPATNLKWFTTVMNVLYFSTWSSMVELVHILIVSSKNCSSTELCFQSQHIKKNKGGFVGGIFGKNGQKLHENYKIYIFEAKKWGEHIGGQTNLSGIIWDSSHPSPPHYWKP